VDEGEGRHISGAEYWIVSALTYHARFLTERNHICFLAQLTSNFSYTPNRNSLNPNPSILPPLNTNGLHGQYPISGPVKTPYPNALGSSTFARYDPYAPPRKPTIPSNPIPSSSSVTKPLGMVYYYILTLTHQ